MDALLNVPCGQGPRGDCGSDAMRPGWQLVRDGDASEDGPVLPGERHMCHNSSLALEMETPAQTDASPQGALPRRGLYDKSSTFYSRESLTSFAGRPRRYL